LQARAISCSTWARPFGKCAVIGEGFSGAISSRDRNLRGNSNFT
jgi:hypothetical protein